MCPTSQLQFYNGLNMSTCGWTTSYPFGQTTFHTFTSTFLDMLFVALTAISFRSLKRFWFILKQIMHV